MQKFWGAGSDGRALELGHLWEDCKGLQHQIFLHGRPFTSESGPVFKFQSCPRPLVPWRSGGGHKTLFPGAAGGQKFSPLCILWLYDLRIWSVVSEKAIQHLVRNRIGSF